MALDKKKLNKLEKLASLETVSARMVNLVSEMVDFEDAVSNQVIDLNTKVDNFLNRIPSAEDIAKKVTTQKGDKGEKGEKGDKGDRGDRGDKGDKGDPAEITQDIIDELALSFESQLPILVPQYVAEATIDGKQIKNLERNIDITKVRTDKLTIDASQVKNLPRTERIIERGGGGSSGIERILSGDQVIRMGATEINFGDNLTVTRTPNGVRVDGQAGGGSGGGAEIPTGTVDGSNVTFIVTNTPKLVMTENGNYVENNGYTIAGSTLTLTIPPSEWIRSLY